MTQRYTAQHAAGLIVTGPDGQEMVVARPADPFLLVGSHPRAALRLDDPTITRRHALFLFTTQGLFFKDLTGAGDFRLDGEPALCGWLDATSSLKVGPYQIRLLDGGASQPKSELDLPDRECLTKTWAQGNVLASLIVHDASGSPYRIALDSPLTLVGRETDDNWLLTRRACPRVYAALVHTTTELWVADLASRHGVLVNRKPVVSAWLQNGDRVWIGRLRFTVSVPEGSAATPRAQVLRADLNPVPVGPPEHEGLRLPLQSREEEPDSSDRDELEIPARVGELTARSQQPAEAREGRLAWRHPQHADGGSEVGNGWGPPHGVDLGDSPSDASQIKFDDVVRVLRRRKWHIAVPIVLALALAGAYLAVATPTYRATTSVLVLPQNPATLPFDTRARADDREPQYDYLATHASLIMTPVIVSKARESAGLDALTSVRRDAPVDLTAAILKNLSVAKDTKGAKILTVTYEGTDPDDCVKILDAVVESYQRFVAQMQRDRKTQVADLLRRAKQDLEDRISKKEREYADFVEKNPLVLAKDANGENPVLKRLAGLETARSDAALKGEQVTRQIQATASLQPLGQPRIKERLQDLRTELAAHKAIEQTLKEARDQEKLTAHGLTALFVRDQIARDELSRLRTQYEATISQLNEVRLTEDYQTIVTQVVQPAVRPNQPVKPNRLVTILIALLSGAVVGVGVTYLQEKMDKSFRSAEEIKQTLELPILGQIPAMQDADVPRNAKTALRTHQAPQSLEAEAYRRVRISLCVALRSLRGSILQVTSPLPGDGKTTLAANVAISLAQANRRVLLIDADMRRPRLHEIFDASRERGLADILTGQTSLDEAVVATMVNGLDLIPCGKTPPNPAELLDSVAFREMLSVARRRYDYVLCDTPALLAAADASIVAAQADSVLLAIRNTRDARPIALHARETVEAIGARILGVVVNAVQPGQDAWQYGYRARGNYYRSRADSPEDGSHKAGENGHATASSSTNDSSAA